MTFPESGKSVFGSRFNGVLQQRGEGPLPQGVYPSTSLGIRSLTLSQGYSESQDIPGRVDVPVMERATTGARPGPDGKRHFLDPMVAYATGLRRRDKTVGITNRPAIPFALVFKAGAQ